ncbi:hypothetical protein Gotri_008844, partial [Gossypium trilobum]|nr:hypothetical protein [Gossypium trilobum]
AVKAKPDQKVIQVVKTDGKILEFRAPLLVKDRIKVVITKQELQQLLAKQVSVQEVLAGLEKRNGSFVESPRNWKPKLDSILEENDQ